MISELGLEIPTATDAPGKAAHRLDFLDALRGLAALAVIFQHSLQMLSASYSSFAFSIFDLGNFGVMLFFLCSGFIIPVSLERQASLRNFWIRRFFRLYPLYWFCIGLSLLLGYRAGWLGFPDKFFVHPVAFVLANMTMLQSSLGFSDLLGPAWTLMFEFVFYVIVSIQFRMGLIKYTVLMAVGVLLSAVLVEGIIPLTIGIRLPHGIISFYGTMFVGTVLYRYSNGEIRLATLQRVLALAVFTEVITLVGDIRIGPIWTHWITARLLAYTIFIVALAFRKRFSARLLCRIGVISYSIYLIHPLVIGLIPQQQSLFLTVVVWLVAIIPVGALTYYVIERPAIALGRRLSSAPGGASAHVRAASVAFPVPIAPVAPPPTVSKHP